MFTYNLFCHIPVAWALKTGHLLTYVFTAERLWVRDENCKPLTDSIGTLFPSIFTRPATNEKPFTASTEIWNSSSSSRH